MQLENNFTMRPALWRVQRPFRLWAFVGASGKVPPKYDWSCYRQA